MLKKSLVGLFAVFIFNVAAFAQEAYTPAANSAERKAILNALRVPVEKELNQKIQFSIDHFKVQGNWAFVFGEPQNTTGGEPNYQITPYADEVKEGIFDNNFQALLKKTNGKWKVVASAIGCTDVCWIGWDEAYNAPKTIFPTVNNFSLNSFAPVVYFLA